MPAPRTDVHKPSTAEPADYRQLGVFYQGNSEDLWDCYAEDHRDLEEQYRALFGAEFPYFTGSYSDKPAKDSNAFDGWFQRSWQCDCCGARFKHGAVYLHVPSNKIIRVGRDCAENLFSFSDRRELVRNRKEKVAKERKALAVKREKFLEVAENAEAVAYLTEFAASGKFNSFYSDLLSKLNKWGDLSERQVAAVLKGKAKDAEKVDEPPEITASVIEGRITVTGEVLSTKYVEGFAYGQEVLKMLVKDDRGFKVWGSVPSVIYGVQRGDRVTFSAGVERSKDDETFGFFKRPTKASVLVGEE